MNSSKRESVATVGTSCSGLQLLHLQDPLLLHLQAASSTRDTGLSSPWLTAWQVLWLSTGVQSCHSCQCGSLLVNNVSTGASHQPDRDFPNCPSFSLSLHRCQTCTMSEEPPTFSCSVSPLSFTGTSTNKSLVLLLPERPKWTSKPCLCTPSAWDVQGLIWSRDQVHGRKSQLRDLLSR